MRLRDLFRSKAIGSSAKSGPNAVQSATSDALEILRASATTSLQDGQLELAVRQFSELIALKPYLTEAYYKRGNAFNRMSCWQEALSDYNQTVSLDPMHSNAFCNLGTVLERLGQFEAALSSYDRAVAINSNDPLAFYNRAGVLRQLKRLDDALASYDRAIALNVGYADAYVNRGHLLHMVGRLEDAATSYGKALQLRPLVTREDSNGKLAPLLREQRYLLGLRRHTLMQICAWQGIDLDLTEIAAGLRARLPVIAPFPALGLLDVPALHRAAAESWIVEEAAPNPELGPVSCRPGSNRIHLGYFSADFRTHVVSNLAAGIFENHDRTRFEVSGFAFGPEGKDAMSARLEKAFDRFVDVRRYSDRHVASLARELKVDIAIDLNGMTDNSRTKIFAFRAAPVQVNYLGYPGTMGAEFIDYIIADGMVIPRAQQAHYAESIIYMPDCFLPFDHTFPISECVYSREALGLPVEGFVFCCFSNCFKITPEVFRSWMRILSRAKGSVLWLSQFNSVATRNLREEADRCGADQRRIVFADRGVSLPEHLARLRSADLFLDTFPYNGHATAIETLWAGVPVLTCPGESFASRVAASLLRTAALPELIASSPGDYEEKAVLMANEPSIIAPLRRRLLQRHTPLFDTRSYTRNLEEAYAAIHLRRVAGQSRAHVNDHLAT